MNHPTNSELSTTLSSRNPAGSAGDDFEVNTIFNQPLTGGGIQLPPLPRSMPQSRCEVIITQLTPQWKLSVDLPAVQSLVASSADASLPPIRDMFVWWDLQVLIAHAVHLARPTCSPLFPEQGILKWEFQSYDGTILNGLWTAWRYIPNLSSTSEGPAERLAIQMMRIRAVHSHNKLEDQAVILTGVDPRAAENAAQNARLNPTSRPNTIYAHISITSQAAADSDSSPKILPLENIARAKDMLTKALDGLFPTSTAQSQPGQYLSKLWYTETDGGARVANVYTSCPTENSPGSSTHSTNSWTFRLDLAASSTALSSDSKAPDFFEPLNLLHIRSNVEGVTIEVAHRFHPHAGAVTRSTLLIGRPDISPIQFATLNLLDKRYLPKASAQ